MCADGDFERDEPGLRAFSASHHGGVALGFPRLGAPAGVLQLQYHTKTMQPCMGPC